MRTPHEIQTAFADRSLLAAVRRPFFVGIGGAGMAPLAVWWHQEGVPVAGSDSTESDEIERLRARGIHVSIGHRRDAVPADCDALILTDAIDLDRSPEVAAARERGIPLFRRSQLLGFLTRHHRVIAVTGTHGKTTTTGMVASALQAAGLDPTVVVGAFVPDLGGSIRRGNSPWAVVEACEAYDSFHDLDPTLVVLTNLEPDHLDFHRSWENLRASVVRFVNRVPADGALFFAADDPGAVELAQSVAAPGVPYDLNEWPAGLTAGWQPGIPGEKNRLNARGALAVVEWIGADVVAAAEGIARFHGADRRLQTKRSAPWVIDDYAHHPTEIDASLQAIREQHPDRRITVVFQPHLYSRTADQLEGFVRSLAKADRVVITDIYPARERPIPGISSARIAEGLEALGGDVRYVPSRHLLPRTVVPMVNPEDVVVGMGAGNISEFVAGFMAEWDRMNAKRPVHVAVAFAGDSAEREVSILSGNAIADALANRGFRVTKLDITERLLATGDLHDLTGPDRPDLVFLAVHGTNAEDGALQGLLEVLHLPYTGSRVQGSAIAMDKEATKVRLAQVGIRTPKGIRTDRELVAPPFPGPWVVKPNAQGSTVGLSFVQANENLNAAIRRGLAYDGAVLVEEWVVGMEISTPVLVDQPLSPVEICPKGGRYDFAAKYTPGATDEICPARLPGHLLAEAKRIAHEAHTALGCRGATRTDMIVRNPDHEDAEIFVLEVNTLPGMTGTSLLPMSARTDGIPFDELCVRIAADGLGVRPDQIADGWWGGRGTS